MAGLFPPQTRDWCLHSEVPLTPRAAERVARECARSGSFADAARGLSVDWQLTLAAKQIQRWGEALGRAVLALQEQEARAYEAGVRPEGPLNPPVLLVVGLDGGRVQMREKDPASQSRWKETKAMSVTSYLPGDGKDRPPEPLVGTCVATLGSVEDFEPLIGPELARRGQNRAAQVLHISDGGNWIDPLAERQKIADVRIIDYYHAAEHLHAAALAASCGEAAPAGETRYEQLKALLWEGRLEELLGQLQQAAEGVGPVQDSDGPEHPRRVLWQNLGYFRRHQHAMNYAAYRAKGWPIGSGPTEAAIKQMNKRVKGSEMFWSPEGVKAILALRTLWNCQDLRWERHWAQRPAYGRAA